MCNSEHCSWVNLDFRAFLPCCSQCAPICSISSNILVGWHMWTFYKAFPRTHHSITLFGVYLSMCKSVLTEYGRRKKWILVGFPCPNQLAMWQQFENNFAKSTDIYIVADEEGSQFALKLHRLVQLYSIQSQRLWTGVCGFTVTFKPWPNGLASWHKFWTSVQLAFHLATHLCWLASTCNDLCGLALTLVGLKFGRK